MHRSLFVLLSLIFFLSSASAQSTNNWRKLQSDHFLLVGDASERRLRSVAEDLEQFRSVVLDLMRLQPSHEIPTTVFVFRNDRAFEPFKPLVDGRPATVSGYYQPGQYRHHIAMNGDTEPERVIYHEYIHQLTGSVDALPLWVREGVAEFYSTTELRSNNTKVRLGRAIEGHLEELQTSFIPLRILFQVDRDSEFYNEARKQGTFYAQSWALMHYLLLGNRSRNGQLTKFTDLLAAGSDLDSSFETAFEADVRTLEDELLQYTRFSLTWPAVEVTLERRVEDLERLRATALSEEEAAFYQGDLLLQIGRLDEARNRLERSLELNADFEPALTAMFLLDEKRGEALDGMKYLERAVQASAAGYLPRYLYARAILSSSDPDPEGVQEAEAQLRNAIALKPDFMGAYILLGQFLLRRRDSADEAVRILGQAVRLDITNQRVAMAYATALWLSGQSSEAEEILSGIARNPRDAAVGEQAEQIRRQIRQATDVPLSRSIDEGAGERSVEEAAPPRLTRPAQATAERPEPAARVEDLSIRPVFGDGLSQIEGRLSLIDCSRGIRLTVMSRDQAMLFATDQPQSLEFLSYSADVQDSISCGPVLPPRLVRIHFRPAESSDAITGEPVGIEFLPE